jgi:hypothetical protein
MNGGAKTAVSAAEDVVLSELRKLDDADVPFALHFLVPFQSARVKKLAFDLLERGVAMPGEVYPLLGRQRADARIRALLEQGLDDRSEDARAGAAAGLSFLAAQPGFSESLAIAARLRALFAEEDADDVRRRIVFALARLAQEGIDQDATVSFLRAELASGDRRFRFPIALALLQLGDDAGIDDVRERAALMDESADHYDLVAPALKALSDHGRRFAATTTT